MSYYWEDIEEVELFPEKRMTSFSSIMTRTEAFEFIKNNQQNFFSQENGSLIIRFAAIEDPINGPGIWHVFDYKYNQNVQMKITTKQRETFLVTETEYVYEE